MRRRGLGFFGIASFAAMLVTAVKAAEPVRVEPGNGVTFSSDDGSTTLNLGMYTQFRFQLLDQDQWRRSQFYEVVPPFTVENVGVTQPSFEVRRFRLFAKGSLHEPWITYRVEADLAGNDEGLRRVFIPEWQFSSASPSFPQLDIRAGQETQDNRTVKTLDAYVDLAPRTAAGVRIGAFKVPYGRQELVSDYLLQMTARSIASDQFAPSRDRGVMFYGGTPNRVIEWRLGAFNGTGLSEGQNLDKTLAYAARLTATSKGPYLDVESVSDASVTSGSRIQGGFSWYRSTDTPKRDDPRTPIGTVDDARFAADFEMYWKRANVTAEYYTRTIQVDAVGGLTGRPGIDLPKGCLGAYLEGRLSCDQQGYYVQAGFLFGPRSELSARYSKTDNDKELSSDERSEATLNFTRYIKGHALKWSVSASYFKLGVNAEGSSAFAVKTSKVNSLDMTEFFLDEAAFPKLDSDRNLLVTAQLQWAF
ncbi:MAG: OprO/OprP family phosphate-selective porin [Acidobacteriia bacterium]|nr:OprO/OprP family phosphate-selective porin [Terriglobia bacterium]